MTRDEFQELKMGDIVLVSGFRSVFKVSYVQPRAEDEPIAKVRLHANLASMLVPETLAFKLTKVEEK